ncbi:hypothetical protein L7F22_026415 [Adiantum nelumboides]|nr:hypothetical protein [Adiantum nelumboides]
MSARELRAVTDHFDATNVLGFGALSVCYKGVIEDMKSAKQRVVAVKRLNVGDSHGVEARRSFVNELNAIYKVRHRNLVKVTGYCVEGGKVALVMEYMKKGDLDGDLYGGKGSLSWDERLNEALDVAKGLVYLYHEYVQPIIHCDLKHKNILLRIKGVAKISDFGIVKLLDLDNVVDMSISKFKETFGYAALGRSSPPVFLERQVSPARGRLFWEGSWRHWLRWSILGQILSFWFCGSGFAKFVMADWVKAFRCCFSDLRGGWSNAKVRMLSIWGLQQTPLLSNGASRKTIPPGFETLYAEGINMGEAIEEDEEEKILQRNETVIPIFEIDVQKIADTV